MHTRARRFALSALLLGSLATGGCDQSALALTEHGSAITDFDLSAIDHHAHTVTARVMLQFPDSHHNVILGADATNAFRIEKVESESGKTDPPRLRVSYGGQSKTFHNTNTLDDVLFGLQADRWYDLAITVDSSKVLRLYIDGKQASIVGGGSFVLPAGVWASGHLTFGEGATSGGPRQYYGMIDDVRVWQRTLSTTEVAALAQGAMPADDPVRSWEFDAPDNLPTMVGNAEVRVLTDDVDWSDLQPIPQHAPLRLPLEEQVRVTQGVDSPPGNSHRGYAAFALDLVKDEGSSRGLDVLAAASGTVVFRRSGSPDDEANQEVPECTPCPPGQAVPSPVVGHCRYLPNVVLVDHGGGLFTEYVHLMPGSIPSSIQVGTVVQTGDVLGQVGRSGTAGDHLHFSVASAVSMPQGPNPSPSIGLDVPVPGGCGYYPAVRPFGVVTRAFVFEAYRRRTGDHWDILEAQTPALGERIWAL